LSASADLHASAAATADLEALSALSAALATINAAASTSCFTLFFDYFQIQDWENIFWSLNCQVFFRLVPTGL